MNYILYLKILGHIGDTDKTKQLYLQTRLNLGQCWVVHDFLAFMFLVLIFSIKSCLVLMHKSLTSFYCLLLGRKLLLCRSHSRWQLWSILYKFVLQDLTDGSVLGGFTQTLSNSTSHSLGLSLQRFSCSHPHPFAISCISSIPLHTLPMAKPSAWPGWIV